MYISLCLRMCIVYYICFLICRCRTTLVRNEQSSLIPEAKVLDIASELCEEKFMAKDIGNIGSANITVVI